MDLNAWAPRAVRQIRQALADDAHWQIALEDFPGTATLHLAVLIEPYLSYVLNGAKSVESRFSRVQCAPFGRVGVGDIVLLKAASGPVRGICAVAKTWFYDLRAFPLASLRERYAKSMCAMDDDFWRARDKAEYATLIKLRGIRQVPPLPCPKRDRRGWVVLNSDRKQLRLPY